MAKGKNRAKQRKHKRRVQKLLKGIKERIPTAPPTEIHKDKKKYDRKREKKVTND